MFEPGKGAMDGENSVLRSLTITRLHTEAFGNLLQYTNSLRSLACAIPNPGPLEPAQSTHSRTRAELVRIPYGLSTQSFMPSLNLLSSTLISLHIHSTGQAWDNFASTRLDFSNSPVLKELKVSRLYFFCPISMVSLGMAL